MNSQQLDEKKRIQWQHWETKYIQYIKVRFWDLSVSLSRPLRHAAARWKCTPNIVQHASGKDIIIYDNCYILSIPLHNWNFFPTDTGKDHSQQRILQPTADKFLGTLSTNLPDSWIEESAICDCFQQNPVHKLVSSTSNIFQDHSWEVN
jgi:hypothetical protein